MWYTLKSYRFRVARFQRKLSSVMLIDKIVKYPSKTITVFIFSFDPDPTVRNSFWTLILGCAVTWSTPNQAIIQRYMSCSSTTKARQ